MRVEDAQDREGRREEMKLHSNGAPAESVLPTDLPNILTLSLFDVITIKFSTWHLSIGSVSSKQIHMPSTSHTI